MLQQLTAILIGSALAGAIPQPHQQCRDVQIPVKVLVPRLIINTTIHDNWDAASLSFNLTRRDATSPADPLPVAGVTDAQESTFQVGARLCGSGKSVLVLTHGILESQKYWDPTFPGGDQYSFIKAAVGAGYSVLSYDRIGVGSSSKISSSKDAQFKVEGAVLAELVSYARKSMHASKVALVGHSYGSYISVLTATATPVDAIVLTGYSGSFANFTAFVAGASFRVAKQQSPLRWGNLDSGYLTSADLYAETYVFFAEPHFDHAVAEWSYNVNSEPFAIGELPSVMVESIDFSSITAPVYVIQGQYDLSACGGNCVGVLEQTAKLFNGSKDVVTVDNLPAGHNLNLHRVAPQAFQMILNFLSTRGV